MSFVCLWLPRKLIQFSNPTENNIFQKINSIISGIIITTFQIFRFLSSTEWNVDFFFMPKHFPGCTSLHAGAYPKRAPSFRWLQTHFLSYPHDEPETPDHSLVKHSMKTQLQNCSSWRPNPHLLGWGRAVLSPKLRDHRAQNDATSPLEGQEAPVTEREAGVCQQDSN